MVFPLLPPLKKDGDGLAVLPRTGTWEQVSGVALNNIADNLQVTKVDAKYIDIDSIPSMWARPLLFEIALYDEDHPMHECVVGEWRGLLAMLALKEQRKFPLETKLITIPDGGDGKAPEFLQALHRLLPQRTLDAAGTPWDKLYLILFKGNPIGITSPTTLVCTSIDYVKHISVNDVPWYAPPFLCDPIKNKNLQADEKAAVAGWLNDFHKNTITPLPGSPIKVNLAPRILDFIEDLGGAPDGKPKLAGTPLGMSVGIFTGMNFPIAPKEYFTEKLFVISQQNAFLENNILMPKGSTNLKVNGIPVTPILPIKKELLDNFDANELNQRITFEETPTGIKVNLQHPSPGDDGDMIISEEYVMQKDGDDAALFNYPQIVEIDHLPVLEIWPDFRMSDWNAYYTYFTKVQNTFDVKPLSAEPNTCSLGDNTKITRISDFPKAMVCTYTDVNTLKNEEAGILLISAQDSQQGAATWDIGIDFGTSGTTVYRQDTSETTPEPMSFDDRLLQIANSTPANRTKVYQQFFSSRSEETPFFSLFQQHPNSRNKSQAGIKLDPLLDGRIYFVENYKLEENVVSNLKWSPDPEDRIRTQAFIEQICLQCAAEAIHNDVKTINWYFSYPLAFSDADKAAFRTICSNATNACAITGIQKGEVTFESESIATANFFAGRFGGFADGAVCIDIGGETSDISIWQDGTLYWQTSIRFAGRNIFLDLIRHNPDFLKKFKVPDDVIQTLKNTSKSDKFYGQADTWINAWINDSKGGLENLFATYGGQIKDTPFIPLIALGISGLLYYVGLILNYLAENKGFAPTMPNIYIGGNGSRILHWLANGNFTQDSVNKKYLKNIILAASGFDPNAIFEFQITPQPKHEAAAGLVVSKDELPVDELPVDELPVLAGEGFTEDEENYSWTTCTATGNLDHCLI